MKQLLSFSRIAIAVLIYSAANGQVVPPYFTDFESGPAGWTDSTTQGSSWQLGTPNYGNTTGALSGVNAWDIALDTSYRDSTIAFLMSPIFDLTSVANPQLSFWLNYNLENVFDGLALQYSVNGMPWASLGFFGAGPPLFYNWYTNPIIISGLMLPPGWSGNSMTWKQSLALSLAATGMAGQPSVQFRFVFTADEQVHFDGVSIDDFALYDQSADDVGASQVISPFPMTAQGAARPVKVIVVNYGANAQTSFDVSYSLNGGAPVTQTWNGSLAPGGNDTVTFANITVPTGPYTIRSYTSLAGDLNAVNDTTAGLLYGVIPTIDLSSNGDTSSFAPCDIPHLFYDLVNGTTTGLNPGDTVSLQAAWGDGTDTVYQTVIASSAFQFPVTHWYEFPGRFSVRYIASSFGGLGPDTLTHYNEVFLADTCGTLSGTVYLDSNMNCMYDGNDYYLQNVPVAVSVGGNPLWWELTDANGAYQFDVPAGPAYDVTVYPQPGIYSPNCPASGMYNGISNLPSGGNDFAIATVAGFDLEPRLYVGSLSLNTGGHVHASLFNHLLQPVPAMLSIPVDTSLYSLVSVMPPPTTFNNDTLSWNAGTLTYGPAPFMVDLELAFKPSVQVGDTICITAVATPVINDNVPSNNIKTKCRPVAQAADPNVKFADPPGTALNGMELSYQVDFQNTGTDTAVNVFILDTLDANLDISTMRILGHSHPMTTVFIAPRVVKFTFNGIMLPDSASAEPESHGYVAYAISPVAGLAVGTVIQNTAHIYFDFNPSVTTNTTMNTIIGTVGIEPGAVENESLAVYPNPSSGTFTILYRLPEAKAGLFEMYDLQMRKVLEKRLPKGSGMQRIALPELAGGLYQVVVSSGSYRATRKVAVVKER